MGWNGRSRIRATGALARGVCILCTLFMGACGEGSAEVVGTETAWVARQSLLMPTAQYSVLGETDASAVRVGEISCLKSVRPGGGTRPGILMPVPGEVRFELPSGLDPDARILVEMGFSKNTHKKWMLGKVVFEVVLGEELAMSKELRFGRNTAEDEQLWVPEEVRLGMARSLTLRTRPVGDVQRNGVQAIFASLEIREPLEVQQTRASAEHPNIILVVIDTLRADRLEPYGYDRPTSPYIKEVADRGVLFEHTLAPSPWTSPSTASLLLGMDPLRHGFVDAETAFLNYEDTTLPEVCRAAGMRTVAFIANPVLSPGHNFRQGFQEYPEEYRRPGFALVDEARALFLEQEGARFFPYLHRFAPRKPYLPPAPHADEFCLAAPPAHRPGIGLVPVYALYMGRILVEAYLDG